MRAKILIKIGFSQSTIICVKRLYNPAPMNSVTVYVIQAGLSFLMLFLLVRWFIGPYLAAQPIRKAMLVLLSPHIAHHVGLAVLIPGVVGVGCSASADAEIDCACRSRDRRLGGAQSGLFALRLCGRGRGQRLCRCRLSRRRRRARSAHGAHRCVRARWRLDFASGHLPGKRCERAPAQIVRLSRGRTPRAHRPARRRVARHVVA